MGRIIHTVNPTRQRALSVKKMTTEINECLRSPQNGTGLFELGASLAVSLQEIRESVDRTAAAWEKRDYWLKADAFRRQWLWADKFQAGIRESVDKRDQGGLQKQIIELGAKLSSLKTA